MSFFARLFGSADPSGASVQPDSVWLTTTAKLKGVKQQLESSDHGDSVAILVIAHFADTMQELSRLVDGYQGQTPVMPVLAADLSADIARHLATDETQTIEMIVAERHPLTSVDDQVLSQFAELLPCRCRVSYHVALDEPMMQLFAGESVTKMLKAMGMDENEKIESSMVAKRIRTAQKKLTANATGNRSAESMQQWFDLNLPPR